jgi:sterol desaturase/sphingolipid hydroxylase (fatty acid hydroxylase superfamily)
VLEIFYTSLLVVVGLVIAWFAFYVVHRLLHENR